TGLLAGINVEDISYRLAMGDWNNDSFLDLVVTQPKLTKLLVYTNNGNANFSLIETIENVPSAKCIIVGNIDKDADLDLVLSNGNVLLNNGQGKFSHGSPFNFNGEKIELGDIDGDGDLDLVGIAEDSLIVFKNNGTGIFSKFFELPLEHHPNSLVMGDWDNDGDLDLAVAYDESNIITIFKNDYAPSEPPGFALEQNFPNPCSKATYFFYTLPEAMSITLSIYNISGELVTRLFSGYQEAGKHLISLIPGSVSSGIYFFQVHTSKGTKNIKFTVVK
ncbi:MAG TPA: T9SS type A sorting domain-containing protein, partial [bacterium]